MPRKQLSEERKEVILRVRVSTPKNLTEKETMNEVKHLIDKGTGWFWSAGEAVLVEWIAIEKEK